MSLDTGEVKGHGDPMQTVTIRKPRCPTRGHAKKPVHALGVCATCYQRKRRARACRFRRGAPVA